ncbi:hypothetical protein F4604DRAFT_1905032 [Suillus subluteus]|nr:hypothetical protein F4604DRAFT_1905032 [Suillus subluteus]
MNQTSRDLGNTHSKQEQINKQYFNTPIFLPRFKFFHFNYTAAASGQRQRYSFIQVISHTSTPFRHVQDTFLAIHVPRDWHLGIWDLGGIFLAIHVPRDWHLHLGSGVYTSIIFSSFAPAWMVEAFFLFQIYSDTNRISFSRFLYLFFIHHSLVILNWVQGLDGEGPSILSKILLFGEVMGSQLENPTDIEDLEPDESSSQLWALLILPQILPVRLSGTWTWRMRQSMLLRHVVDKSAGTLVHFFLFLMDDPKSRTTELVATLGRRVGEIMGNSSQLEVLKDGRVETELLHKASRLLITKGIKDENSKYEINRATLTIAHAMVNPMNVDWDVNHYGNKVKLSPPNRDGSATAEPERLKKFYPEAVLGKISVPTTVVDRQGNIIVVYLPNILTPSCLDCLLKSLLPILEDKKSWRDDGYMVPEGGGEFVAGRITVAPAYFMQRHERLVDPLVTSQSYTLEKVQQWLAALTTSEVLWNAITATVAPDLFQAGVTTFSETIKEVQRPNKKPALVDSWPSIFSGLEIIANRVTFSHRDSGGSPTLFDLLVSLDLQAELDYSPGTMVYVSGRVLEHSVGPWLNGERLVIAHFMKDAIHERVGRKGVKDKGKNTWKEANISSVYEDSDSEAEPASPSKQKILKITDWWNMIERYMEIFGLEA